MSTEKSYRILKNIVPLSRVCPLCLTYKPDLSKWASTNMGDAVCLACLRLAPELSKTQLVARLPESCPICERYTTRGDMKKIRMWVRTKDTYMCSDCARAPAVPGSYRVDLKGREMRMLTLESAVYVFGTSRVKIRTFPSTLARFLEQQTRMWAIVTTHIRLCDKVASWLTSKTSQTWDDLYAVAFEGLCRASVEMMWNLDQSRGSFEAYAQRAMVNACKNYMKKTARESLFKEEFNSDHELNISLEAYDERVEDSWMRGPNAAKVVERLLVGMNEIDTFILTRRFVDNASFEEIGVELGVLRSAVHNRWAKIKVHALNILGSGS